MNDWFNWFDAVGSKTWSNWALAAIGLVAAIIALCTLKAIRRQADIANQTLAFTHRPRIRVRSLSVKDDVFEAGVNGYAVDLTYEVVNYGGTDAMITDSNCTILLRHTNEIPELPPLPPYDINVTNRITQPGIILKGGEAHRFSRHHIVAPESEIQFSMGHFHVYAIGYLNYRASVGPHYRTGFCRRLERQDFTPTGFAVVTNPNYEYED